MSAPEVFLDGRVQLHAGDCLAVLKTLPAASVDSVVTDPPYHLTSIVKRFGAEGAAPPKVGATGAYARGAKGFMGQSWDGGDIAFRVELWAEVWRVLKPGGHILAFSATRTYHRMALEPICFARKPLIGTIAVNVLTHGTGVLNIDGCRVGVREITDPKQTSNARWPPNVVHDGSDEVLAVFPQTSSGGAPTAGNRNGGVFGEFAARSLTHHGASTGSAARFFYSAKADGDDRLGSKHPTVKPVDLMQWLCRLITPPGGLVLDPFAGTGTTGEAAWREGFSALLIEREAPYRVDIARRMALCRQGPMVRRHTSLKARHLTPPAAGPLFDLDPTPQPLAETSS